MMHVILILYRMRQGKAYHETIKCNALKINTYYIFTVDVHWSQAEGLAKPPRPYPPPFFLMTSPYILLTSSNVHDTCTNMCVLTAAE